MTAMTQFQGSPDPADKGGTATYVVADRVIQVRLASFEDARAIDELIDRAAMQSKRESRKAIAAWLRGAADQMGVA